MPKKVNVRLQDELPKVKGIAVREQEPDENEIYQRAVDEWRKTQRFYARQATQTITFKQSAIALTFIGDVHLGSSGTDYERAFHEAQIVAKAPRMYAILCGDMLDNFIIPKLIAARHDSKIPVQDEWALVKKYLRVIGPKILSSVEGNHERWTYTLSAVPFFQQVLKSIAPNALFDAFDLSVNVYVGDACFPMRVRHHWRSRSKYNATFGIEDAARFDGGFVIGVGAHTHASGLIRSFDMQGRNGYAVLCGSYKRHDSFARERGFPKPNASTAMTLILHNDGSVVMCDNVERAAKAMSRNG